MLDQKPVLYPELFDSLKWDYLSLISGIEERKMDLFSLNLTLLGAGLTAKTVEILYLIGLYGYQRRHQLKNTGSQ